jgi:hypothetical protein
LRDSPDTAPRDDLNDYLQGGSELSRAYQREAAPPPPHLLDRRVLELSQGRYGAPVYLAPLALAASVLLSVALVLAMLFGPQGSKRRDETPHLIRVAALTDPAGSGSLAERLQYYGAEAPPEPARWLAEIGALRRAGRTREADAEWQRFRRAYPDYPAGDQPLP